MMMDRKKFSIFSKGNFVGKDVFEVGSGYGSFTLEYLIDAKSVFGIDTNQEAVDYMMNNWPGSQKTGRVQFQVGNIVDLSLKGKKFDWVVFANSF
jgi:SAM-dependent methyltransferase